MSFPPLAEESLPRRMSALCRTVAARAAAFVRRARSRLGRSAHVPDDALCARRDADGRTPAPAGRPGIIPPAHPGRVPRLLTAAIAALMVASSLLGLTVRGLYQEPPSVVAMVRGLDAVNLAVAVPALAGSLWLAGRGSLRGRILWTGTLAYTLYTYVLFVFGLGFTATFLLHVAVLAMAIYALALALGSADREAFARRFRHRARARAAAIVLGLLGLGLGGIWTYYASRFALAGALPPEGLIVQPVSGLHLSYAADLVLIVPAYLLAAVQLWRQQPWGYLLGGTLLVSGTLQQVGYMAQLAFQSRARISGATATDPDEPPIVVAYLVALVLLLAGSRTPAAVGPGDRTAPGRLRPRPAT
ncbi:hypothetical protein [Arthrobacter sp. L77]|uniref:hypothetical protein n=1 Tax=Arthrobacter sp. L77 TaxID=1496689 RepID=UPI0005BC3185|nr:hypothetical protein [Arthrobacter sp. L77]